MTTALAPTSAILALCAEYQAKRHRLETLHASMLASPDILGYLLEGHRNAKSVSVEVALAGLNAEYWDKAMRLTDILNVMPQSKRTEWNNLIGDKKTPPFSSGRWQAHIEAARGLLKPGGKIIAILPSTASNHPGVNVLSRHDGAFDKTGVSVVIVEVE